MIIWINGTFGVGKTSTARALCAEPSLRLFDPEFVGSMLADQLKDHEFDDFQDLAPWRALVPPVAKQIHDFTSTNLVAVQTVLNASYWDELLAGLRSVDMPVFHVVLDCNEGELRRRIESDREEPTAKDWRLDHIKTFHAARSWMTEAADLVVDTTERPIVDVAATIWQEAHQPNGGSTDRSLGVQNRS